VKITTDWQLCFLENGDKTEFVPASVPGNAGLDYAKAKNYPDFQFSDNYKLFKWMEDKDWLYQTKLPAVEAGKKLFFVSLGIDYQFEILLNGKKIFEQEGMFSPVELLLADSKEGGIFEVLVKKVPKRTSARKDTKEEADRCVKPAVSYGWDWHPRLIPFGIWDESYFEIREPCYIKDMDISYKLNDDLSEAIIIPELKLSEESGYSLKITDADGILQSNPVKNVKLWQPNGHGIPYLYNWELEIHKTGEKRSGRIAIRKIELVNNKGSDEYSSPTLECDKPPFTLRVNNKNIFAKGSNWVNPEIFTGLITADTYRPLVEKAVECNFNLLRVWGGAIVNKKSFFDLCDENGIMVWQEFPLACNNYYGDDYLKILDQESRSIIKRYKNHVTIWCGGNELLNSWSGMNEQSLALRLLDKNCYELDRDKPFLKSSPIMNVGHGSYMFWYPNRDDVFQIFQKSSRSGYVEFGVPSLADYESLETIIPADELSSIAPTKSWVAHHAFFAWDNKGWLFPETIAHYFGEVNDIQETIYYYNWLQCEGYKAVYEEARRQSPYCSMACNWCYNEPWVTAANNSIITYPCRPKPAFFAIKDACRPVLASARIPRFDFCAGDNLNFELWILNDTGKLAPDGKIDAFIRIGKERIKIFTWEYPESDFNIQGPVVNYELPDCAENYFTLALEAGEFSSEYKLKLNNYSGG
jgi:beta-mannosidase